LWIAVTGWIAPQNVPPIKTSKVSVMQVAKVLLPPLGLITLVLGSILVGAATPTEASGVGAIGALVLAILRNEMSWQRLREIGQSTLQVTSMIFLILIGASVFSLVFRGFGGEEMVQEFFHTMDGGPGAAFLLVMVTIFLLGFILDFIEITFVVVPIVGPILLAMGFDPVWLGIMIAVNLQTSFLTPPFGFALFYLRGVASDEVSTGALYRGVIPFVLLQLGLLVILWFFPELISWLPNKLN